MPIIRLFAAFALFTAPLVARAEASSCGDEAGGCHCTGEAKAQCDCPNCNHKGSACHCSGCEAKKDGSASGTNKKRCGCAKHHHQAESNEKT